MGNWRDVKLNTLFPINNETGKSKTITFNKPRSCKLVVVAQDSYGLQTLIGCVFVDSDGLCLQDGEQWSKFQIVCTLDRNGLLQVVCRVLKTKEEYVDVAKTEDVPLTEEEIKVEEEKVKKESE